MLPDLLSQYLQKLEVAIKDIEGAYVETYEEEILAANRLNLRIRVRFQTGHLLELNEAVILESDRIIPLGYRYHFQDRKNKLVFRYDNTPHFPDLKGFPHHKHLSDKVDSVEEPSILKIIQEARQLAK